MGSSFKSGQFLATNAFLAGQMADAARGNDIAAYDLGIAFSTGTSDVEIDLIEAHKWFNIAALRGNEEAPYMRAEVAEEMTAREIIEAQKQARAWLQLGQAQAA